ncbi:hypothetical protein FF1_005225 [Malus domestica]
MMTGSTSTARTGCGRRGGGVVVGRQWLRCKRGDGRLVLGWAERFHNMVARMDLLTLTVPRSGWRIRTPASCSPPTSCSRSRMAKCAGGGRGSRRRRAAGGAFAYLRIEFGGLCC